jgi:hypothetical protein
VFLKTVFIIFPTSFPITYMFWGAFSASSFGVASLSLLGFGDGSELLSLDAELSLDVEPLSLLETELSVSADYGLDLVLPAASLIVLSASGSSRMQ